jgi:hypothetical protein
MLVVAVAVSRSTKARRRTSIAEAAIGAPDERSAVGVSVNWTVMPVVRTSRGVRPGTAASGVAALAG